jgi:hypothetical protein
LLAAALAAGLVALGGGGVRALTGVDAAVAAGSELVANGSFETPTVIHTTTYDTYPPTPAGFGWSVTGNSIDHIRGYWPAYDGSQSVDLDGNAPGGVSQTLATVPGQPYVLRFAYSANPDRLSISPCIATNSANGGAHMSVSWGGAQLASYTFNDANSRTGTPADMKWRTVELPIAGSATTGTTTALSFASTDAPSACGIALDDVSVTASVALSKPVIVRAVSNGSQIALTGRVDGGAGLPVTFSVASSSTCSNGVLGTSAPLGQLTVTPDSSSYFTTVFNSPVPLRSFMTLQATSPAATDPSTCAVVGGENDSWTKAFPIDTTGNTAQDVIDASGQSRWYSFAVQPGSRVTVDLTHLPANYDIALFKDITQSYTTLTSTQQLTKMTAEFAPSAFSPSAFSPSAFSPSAFSPDAYSPSAFSPSAFSGSVFSPSAFSPSAFSPSAFSPSAFSPSAFSPSAFSPSAFSPSAFSPSAFSPSVFDPAAFAAAQTQSLVAVAATPGTGDKTVVANTWTNTGRYYVRVWGPDGAASTAAPFTVTVTTSGTSCGGVAPIGSPPASEPAGGYKTVILTDSSRLPGTAADKSTLQSKLTAFAARSDVQGAIVDLAGDSRVGALNAQADANSACPFAKNLVAGAIKDIVDAYRAANTSSLQYVVILGDDDVVPFFRYPDESLLGDESGYVPPLASTTAGEAALRQSYVLGQDAYGASTQLSLASGPFPVPDLAVGRLVETASDISGMLDAYTATGGVVTPHSSLVTGYDFLASAANSVKDDFAAGTGQQPDTLITPANVSPQDPSSWSASQLGTSLLGSHHDLVFLAGHFSANSALAADFTTSLLTTDVASSAANLTNSIIFSAGCHSGFTIDDRDGLPGVTVPLDWSQVFAQKKATLIAGTGYQYGDTDFVAYSARIYTDFAKQLRTGTGSVSVGQALVRAKQQYLQSTPSLQGIDRKALLESTVYGLPMLGVNMPGQRLPAPGSGSGGLATGGFATNPGAALGLQSADVTVTPSLTQQTVPLTNLAGGTITATYLRGGAGIVTDPAQPALPLESLDVTPQNSSLVLRGVGFLGGDYADSSVVPLTGAATTELRGVHAPFVSPVFFPMRMWNVDYYGALGASPRTTLLVTPAQHKTLSIPDGTSTLRRFSNLGLRLFYSGYTGAAALSAAPDIVDVEATQNGSGGVDFQAHVVGDPAAGIQQVWITYTGDGPSRWTSLSLTQDATDSTLWRGTIPTLASPANLRFIVQAANGVGLVSLDDNFGAYFGVTNAQAATPAGTSLTLVSPPSSGTFGDSATVKAVLTAGSSPLAGENVGVSIGGTTRFATSGTDGSVTVSIPLVSTPGATKITASFAGDSSNAPSGASAPFTIDKAPSSLSSLTQPDAGTATSTLTAALGGQSQPLLQLTVSFSLSGPGGTKTFSVITDYLGRATLSTAGLASGTYSTTASFAGDATYTSATQTGTVVVDHSPPVIAFNGNKGTYGLLDNVAITCTTTDPAPSSGIKAPNPCTGFNVSGPAWSFKPGVNTVPSPGLVATDNAGNSSAPATTTFKVTATTLALCQLTKQFVQSSAKYQALKPAQKTVVNAAADALCNKLAAIVPKLTPSQKAQLVADYKQGVQALVQQGWLTAQQATILKTFVDTI